MSSLLFLMRIFCLLCINIFLLLSRFSLAFINLNKIYLSVYLFNFIFLRVCWAYCMCTLLSLIKLGKSLFLQVFSLSISLLLLLRLPHAYVVLQIIHSKSLRLTYCSSIFVFLYFGLGNAHCAIFKITDSFSAYSNLSLDSAIFYLFIALLRFIFFVCSS